MDCASCGAPIPDTESRCPSCQRPKIGQPRRSPKGSDAPPDEPSKPATTNNLFWGFMALAFLAALVVMLL